MDWGKPKLVSRDSIGSKPSLDENGTRYTHYMELKEIFMQAVVVIDGLRIKTESDLAMRVKMENAVEMIERRIAHLCDYNVEMTSGGNIAREVKAAGIHKSPQLTEGSDATQTKDASQDRSAKDSSIASDMS